jgi:hypothetical protein
LHNVLSLSETIDNLNRLIALFTSNPVFFVASHTASTHTRNKRQLSASFRPCSCTNDCERQLNDFVRDARVCLFNSSLAGCALETSMPWELVQFSSTHTVLLPSHTVQKKQRAIQKKKN